MLRDRHVFNITYGYMESPTAPLDLTLGDLERSKSRSPRFQSLISRSGAIAQSTELESIYFRNTVPLF